MNPENVTPKFGDTAKREHFKN